MGLGEPLVCFVLVCIGAVTFEIFTQILIIILRTQGKSNPLYDNENGGSADDGSDAYLHAAMYLSMNDE